MNDNLIERQSVPIQCEREAFETWASRQQGFGCAANPVDYTLGATRDAWEVWQARAAIERQSVPTMPVAEITNIGDFGGFVKLLVHDGDLLKAGDKLFTAAPQPQPLTGLNLSKHRCPLTGASIPDLTTFGETK